MADLGGQCSTRVALQHLIIHGSVRSRGSTVGDHCIVATIASGEVVGHFSVKLLDCLLFLTGTANATTATALGTATLSTGAGGLRGSCRLRLVLLRLTGGDDELEV